MKIEEIKSYKCSDGKIFNTKVEAEEHEKELANPEYATEKRIAELERKVFSLETDIKVLHEKIIKVEAENVTLSARITALEAKNSFPWSKPNPDIYPQPWPPYQQPFNPTAPTPKLPSQPGDIIYDATQISKMTDEELMDKGYHVYYAGHNRAVIPPSDPLKAHFDNIKTNK